MTIRRSTIKDGGKLREWWRNGIGIKDTYNGGNLTTGWSGCGTASPTDPSAYVFGGLDYISPHPLGTTYKYDNSAWTQEQTMPSPGRMDFASTTIETNAYTYFGDSWNNLLVDCDSFSGISWQSETDGPTPARYLNAASNMDGVAYITGGLDSGDNVLQDVDSFHLTSWEEETGLPFPARYNHTSSTITDLYVAGGYAAEYLQDVDGYDSSSWSAVSDLPTPARDLFSSSTLDSILYVYGGWDDTYCLQDVDGYDTSSWSAYASLSVGKKYSSATNINLSAYVFGGINNDSEIITDCDSFDGTSWSSEASMPHELFGTAAAPSYSPGPPEATTLYVYGGTDNDGCNGFDTSSWTSYSNMNGGRSQHGGVNLFGIALAIGGRNDNTTEGFDTASWSYYDDYPNPANRQQFACSYYDGYAYVMGGYSGLSDNDRYDLSSWSSETDVVSPSRWQNGGFGLSSAAYTAGGYSGSGNMVDLDGFDGSSWNSYTDMPSPGRNGLSGGGTFVYEGNGYVVGGDASGALKDVDMYDESSWTSMSDLPDPARRNPASDALLGIAFVVGGNGPLSDNDGFDGSSWSAYTSITSATSGSVGCSL